MPHRTQVAPNEGGSWPRRTCPFTLRRKARNMTISRADPRTRVGEFFLQRRGRRSCSQDRVICCRAPHGGPRAHDGPGLRMRQVPAQHDRNGGEVWPQGSAQFLREGCFRKVNSTTIAGNASKVAEPSTLSLLEGLVNHARASIGKAIPRNIGLE